MPRYFIDDARTGQVLVDDLPVYGGNWSDPLNDVERISAELDMDDPEVRSLDMRNLGTGGKVCIGVAEGDVILAHGPLWTGEYDRDAATLKLDGLGMGSIFDYRTILPLVAKTLGITQFTIPDPTDNTKTIPNPAVATYLNGLSLGTIAKRWIQQAMTWAGGDLPIVFQADEAGVHERNVEGADFKRLGDALQQLQRVEGGPDLNFQARFKNNGRFVETLFETGSQAEPMIFGTSVHKWNLTAEDSPVHSLSVKFDAKELADLGWATGGRAADKVLVARSVSDYLVSRGFVLFEQVDTTHTSVVLQPTLDAYAKDLTDFGSHPWEEWSFKVRADVEPRLGTYTTGDFCELHVDPFDSETDAGDPYIPGGDHQHRIIGRSGDVDSDDVTVYTAAKRSV